VVRRIGRGGRTQGCGRTGRRWVTREDFAWIAERGLNAVRIPFGHWVLGPPYPYHPVYGARREPFVTGGIEVLDRALRWAEEFGLKVVLDLHAPPAARTASTTAAS